MIQLIQGFLSVYWVYSRGATAIEYALIGAGIALTIIATIFALGDDLNDVLTTASNAMDIVDNQTSVVDPSSAVD